MIRIAISTASTPVFPACKALYPAIKASSSFALIAFSRSGVSDSRVMTPAPP